MSGTSIGNATSLAAGSLQPTDVIPVERPGVTTPYKTTINAINRAGSFVVNVEDHGAVAGTDCTAAIQAAIDEVTDAGGGTVFLPLGIYYISEELLISDNYVNLRGASKRKRRIIATDAYTAGNMIRIQAATNAVGVHLERLQIEAPAVYGTNTLIGINNVNGAQCYFEDLSIMYMDTGILCKSYTNRFASVHIHQCVVGAEFQKVSNSISWIGGAAVNCGTGMKFMGGLSTTVLQSDIEGCGVGVYVGAGTVDLDIHGYFEDNDTEVLITGDQTISPPTNRIKINGHMYHTHATNTPIVIDNCRNVSFDMNVWFTPTSTYKNPITIGARVDGLDTSGLTVRGFPVIPNNFSTPIRGAISRNNLVRNGNFQLWGLGATAAPDGWVANGSLTLSKVTDDDRDGDNVIELTEVVEDDYLSYDIQIPPAYRKAGVNAILVADMKCVSGTAARIHLVPDGSGINESRDSADNGWVTYATPPVVLTDASTKLTVGLYPLGGVSRFARVAVYFGSTPWAYERSPLDMGALHRDITVHTYGDAGTTDLATYVLPGGTIKPGHGIKVRAAGNISGTTDAKTVRIKFGTNDMVEAVLAAAENGQWYLELEGYRATSTSLVSFRKAQWETFIDTDPYATLGLPSSLESDLTIAVNATLANAADEVTLNLLTIEKL